MDIRLDSIRLRLDAFSLTADLAVPSGASVALVGPSGAGKSSVLNLVAGFLAPAEGRIWVGGKDQTQTAPSDRPVTMVFQDHNLFPHLNVADNVALGLDPGLRLSPQQVVQRQNVLADVDLDGMLDRKPADLSGGQQSRVALARALVRDRPVLLLDELFAALGPALRAEMLDLVRARQASSGMTVLMVTHDIRDAERIADLVILVADGVAHAPVATRRLLADPPQALRDYLGT